MENHVVALKEIEMAVVVAQPHPKWDERPIVICKVRQNIDKAKIMEHLRKKFSKFQLPDDILYWEEIPMTGTGKMSKKMVREKLKREKYKLPDLRQKSKL